MKAWQEMTVWLSYVSYPVTTAVYLERALRRLCRVVTVGPRLPEQYIESWALENMKLPIAKLDIDTDLELDLQRVFTDNPGLKQPDLLLWVESGISPKKLEQLTCPTACYLIDNHIMLATHLEQADQFDFVFIAQRKYLEQFREINPRTYWLPLGCDPEVHGKFDLPKRYDAGFVGSIRPDSRRNTLLQELAQEVETHYERCFWHEMAKVFSESRMVFNEAVNNDLNMRFFEVLSTGSLLLSDMAAGSGQDELFVAGEDYALYHDPDLPRVARFYLDNELIRERIAARGQQLVHNAHTYQHRVEDLLQVVTGLKSDTFSAQELRQRSVADLPDPDADWRTKATHPAVPARSFVIPVLDYSPASEYNITTLLADLEQVPGQVIVVFNSEQVGADLRNHPRIDHHVVMNRNIGVSRAWNVGLEISESSTVFILNADLHVSGSTLDLMEQTLLTLEDAACVGPQGSFVNFELATDHCYFDKGSFTKPFEVDAVSGFLFCVRRELFADGILRFESAYTPCYFEEWDLGLQIKLAGYKSYVVPATDYEHHWSGSIRALRTIPYLGRDETAGEILFRNRDLFQLKWRGLAKRAGRQDLLQSGWGEHAVLQLQQMVADGNGVEAAALGDRLLSVYPGDAGIQGLCRLVRMMLLKQQVCR